MKPIFIMSSERSGSNLVREMLNAHPNISAPPAAQLPKFLSSNRYYYGDLSKDENIKRMIADAVLIGQTHPEKFEVKESAEEIFQALTERSVWGVISALYDVYAREQGKSAWASKDNYLFNFALPIQRTLPNAKFIYLFRDGRDYACSMRKVSPHQVHVYDIARQWREEQRACLQTYYDLKDDGCMFPLRYEDLLINPEKTLRNLCAFLDEPFDAAMLNFHEGGTAKKLASQSPYWENLSKPVMSSNFAKFKNEMTPKEIALFESIAGRELTLLGYPRITEVPLREPTRWQRIGYKIEKKYILWKRGTEREDWRKPREDSIATMKNNLYSSSHDPIVEPLIYDVTKAGNYE